MLSVNKKLFIFLTSILIVVLAGCSQDAEYEKLMSNATQAMGDYKLDEALENYNGILKMNPNDLSYGDTRIAIVQSLAASTEELSAVIGEVEEEVADVRASFKELEYKPENLDALEEFNSQIEYVLGVLEPFPNTALYQDMLKVKKEFDENIETKVVKVLKEDIDQDLENVLFEDVEEKVSQLTRIHNSLATENNGVDQYDELIKKEREKYIILPYKITDRNQVLYENKDIGKVTFLGEGMKDEVFKAFYKYEGDIRFAADSLGLQTKFIFSDGNYKDISSFEYSYYDGYVIAEQVINGEKLKIERVDYRLNFMEEEKMETFTLDDEAEEMTIGGVKLFGEKSFATGFTLEDQEKVINITTMTVQSNKIILSGNVTSKADLDLKGDIFGYRPFLNSLAKVTLSEELFRGIAKDFKVEISWDKTLLDAEKYVQVHFLGFHLNIDLNTGKEFSGSEVDLTDIVYFPNEYVKVESYYDKNGKSFFQDHAGKTYANVMSVYNSSTSNPGQITIPVSKKYETLKVNVGVDKRYAEAGYGSSKVTFKDDEKVLKEINLGADAQSIPVELDLSNVDNLYIAIEQKVGDLGSQGILFGNGKFKMKEAEAAKGK